ncbi:MAG: hypothetical protein QXF26_04995 [Candidatus Bathyarchaeia archaeon]
MYEGDDLIPPEEVLRQFKGLCPRCGNKLVFDPRNIEFIILDSRGVHGNG